MTDNQIITEAHHQLQHLIAVALIALNHAPQGFVVLGICILAGIMVLSALVEWFL